MGVLPTRMMPMGVWRKQWPTPLYTGVSLVGSSVQNNNGILSGFTGASYATMPFYWTAGASQIEAVIKIHFAQSGSAQGIWGCVGRANAFTPFYYQGNNGPLGSYISTSGASAWNATPDGANRSKKVYWQNTNPASAGDYILRVTFSSGSVATSHWSGSWSQDSSNSLAAVHGAANLVPQLGTNRGSNNPFLGTIDLNYTYLMRDGELWWEGAPGAYKNVKTTYPDSP